MTGERPPDQAAGDLPRRLFFFNAGFLRQTRVRRILELAGHDLRLGLPGEHDAVAVWGRSVHARRGEAVAARFGVPVVRIEDAFLRSLRPGRMAEPPLGLMIDPVGVHFDSAVPSTLETILAHHPLDNSNLLMRARDGLVRLETLDLSKYNLHRPDADLPPAGYVLVVDQVQGDASVAHAGASALTFQHMLTAAQRDYPQARIVIKTHPETALGLRTGHFTAADQNDRIRLLTDPVSPWRLLQGAQAVYTVSSQLGFEAIMAGHRPRVFGQPFYVGWGLSADQSPVSRRRRSLTKVQLFAAAMILAPTWYDAFRDRLCSFEDAVDQLEATVRAHREDRAGHVACGMRLWKRGRMQAVFGHEKPLIFQDNPVKAVQIARATGRGLLIWASKEPDGLPDDLPVRRVEDGFLRSRGLGAALVPPLSLVADDLGIYYDPNRPSSLERMIQTPLSTAARLRVQDLVKNLLAARLSKYNLTRVTCCDLPDGLRVLVPGQVEDDASIRLGAGDIRTNLDLLRAARSLHPEAQLIYKPHPDVEAGLRRGVVLPADAQALGATIAAQADPIALINACDAVVTITSLLGFEALLRGKPVTCLGTPFYAGWGLTRDAGPVPKRRLHAPDGHALPRPDLMQLAHAALISYPRYHDPVTRRPCPPEVVVHRLANGTDAPTGLGLRLLSKLQGRFATYARFWR